uniref:Uncharacterized protein n=1 Tax=Anguilla anguilla TaxID=7936 RepID=A0A0E9RQ00_ANGAN
MRQLSQLVTVKFEELSLLRHIPVEETLTAYQYVCDSPNHSLDYALLQLAVRKTCPQACCLQLFLVSAAILHTRVKSISLDTHRGM